jgi:quinol monooxygenase YgiN
MQCTGCVGTRQTVRTAGGDRLVQYRPRVAVALKIGPSTFGIFDAFADNSGRKAHLAGQLAAALIAKAGELLAQPPCIEEVDVFAVKLAS